MRWLPRCAPKGTVKPLDIGHFKDGLLFAIVLTEPFDIAFRPLIVFGEAIGDSIPRCPRRREYVESRAHLRIAVQCSRWNQSVL